MANVTREFISFVSTDAYGHSRFVNYVQRHATRALGSVVWQQSGIANTRHRAVALAHDVDDRLDRRLIVAAFTQGEFQLHSVEAVEDGLIGLLRRYEVRHLKQTGRELRIPVVPVGIEYENDGKGLQLSGVMRWLAANVPKFPDWSVPAAGSKIVVRFGKPLYFEGRSPHELTDVAMREAAALSDIPYNVSR